jgi:competence CoiA-like predicted nuclease
MIYAKGSDGGKILPSKGLKGTCFECGEELISKCGDIKTWHWSHTSDTNCDSYNKVEKKKESKPYVMEMMNSKTLSENNWW